MVQIRFIKFGANSQFGSFEPGNTMRCAQALAAHLVDELQVAEYMAPKAPTAVASEAKPVAEPPQAKRNVKKGK